jgi:hypothetical protein
MLKCQRKQEEVVTDRKTGGGAPQGNIQVHVGYKQT